jgi:hypothetical protein
LGMGSAAQNIPKRKPILRQRAYTNMCVAKLDTSSSYQSRTLFSWSCQRERSNSNYSEYNSFMGVYTLHTTLATTDKYDKGQKYVGQSL